MKFLLSTISKWNCKYHIVFKPKYRRKVFYEEKRIEVGAILRKLCEWKGVNIIEAVCIDHVHILVEISHKMSNLFYDVNDNIMVLTYLSLWN